MLYHKNEYSLVLILALRLNLVFIFFSNNLEDVREEWERIRLSYSILKDKKLRIRYDRNSVLADPGAAMSRAAGEAALSGLANVGKGIFQVGTLVRSLAFKQDSADK